MFGLDRLDTLFVVWAFSLQIIFIVHFAVRKRLFETYTLKIWLAGLCPVYPGLPDQHHTTEGRKKLVILAGRIPVPDSLPPTVTGWITSKNSIGGIPFARILCSPT